MSIIWVDKGVRERINAALGTDIQPGDDVIRALPQILVLMAERIAALEKGHAHQDPGLLAAKAVQILGCDCDGSCRMTGYCKLVYRGKEPA